MNIEKEILKIKERNHKAEADKAWETSLFRRIVLMIFTYLTIGIYLNAIGISNAWLNAIVPALGFMFSTLTLPFFKNLWLKYFYKVSNKKD